MTILVMNDLHFGVNRTGGTTPQSLAALRKYLLDEFHQITCLYTNTHLIINGDLLDAFSVEPGQVVEVYKALRQYVSCPGNALTLVMGNHDANARGDKMSSFHLLSHFFMDDMRVSVVDHTHGFRHVDDQGVWAISHQMNQDLFEYEIGRACEMDGTGKYLLLHCNYKNAHTEGSSHSLNLSDEMVGNLMRAGWSLVIAHEHKGYSLRGGRVKVIGNQTPSSVYDCIGDDQKHMLKINDDGSSELVPTWSAAGSYVEADWRDLDVGSAKFIRVVGDARTDESADVIKAIAKLRQTSDAFVITNAVKVEGQDAVEEMSATSIEDVKQFDVMAAIFESLDPKEVQTIKELLA